MEFGFDWRTDYGETYKYSFWRLEYQLTQSKFAPEATFDNEWDSLSSTNFSKRHGEGRSTSFRQYSLDCPEMDDSFYDFDDPELCRARSSPTYGDDDQQEVDYEIEKSAPKRVAMNMHKRRSVKTNASQKGVEGGGEDPVPKKLPVELKQSASESPSPRRFMRSRSFLSKQITRSKKAQDVEKGDISKGERDGDVIIVTEEEILKTRKNMIIRRTVESGFRFFKDRGLQCFNYRLANLVFSESSLSLPNVMSVWSRNHHRMAVLGSIYGALQNFKPEFLKKDNGTVIEFESVYVEPTQEESPFNEESQEEIIIESDISSSFSPPHGELDTEKEASPEAPDHSFMVPRCESPIEEFDYFVKEERQFFSYAAEYAKYRRSPPRYKSQNQFQHIYGQLHNKDYDDVITID
ncbi:hypothetical protein L5515_000803 [Caenorhabditis briggsae]|uniref:Uncharacterized protein n=1 Tax=Caenorhabditis briggsae TaxID=6238 RepID=A0AAE9E139_CAEBR|nr:hypothetical protein L5515_000803 [Caenorhabditis briggsae]